jgi:hypothetical protein
VKKCVAKKPSCAIGASGRFMRCLSLSIKQDAVGIAYGPSKPFVCRPRGGESILRDNNKDTLGTTCTVPECRRKFSYIPNVGFNCVYNLVDTTGEDEFPHGDCEANDLVRLDMGRQRKRIWIGDHINQRRTRMLKRLL